MIAEVNNPGGGGGGVSLEQAQRGQRGAMLSQAIRLLCKAAGVLVLARLVTPAGHGQFALVASVWVLLSLFRDLGLGVATVQAREISAEQKTALFWMHLLIGVGLAGIASAVAPLVAWFFAEPKLCGLMLASAGAFVLVGAGGLARGWLVREARFAEVNAVETWMAVAGTAAMIGAAWLGAEAYAFVVFLIVSEAVATGLAWRFLAQREREAASGVRGEGAGAEVKGAIVVWPRGGPRFAELRGLGRMGSQWLMFQLLGHALQQVDAVLIGRVWGVQAAGLYSRAAQLLAMPGLFVAAPLGQVAMVAMARSGQLGREAWDFAGHSRRTATVTAYLIWPLFAVCAVVPEDVVRVVLGGQWPEAAPAMRWLAVSAWAASVSALGTAVVVAAGQTRRLLGGAWVNVVLVAAAVVVGLERGLAGVACAVAVVNVSWALPRLAWMLGGMPGEFAKHVGALAGPAVVTGAFALGAWTGRVCFFNVVAGEAWAWMFLVVSGLSGAVAGALVAAWCPRVRREMAWVAASLPLPGRGKFVKEETK